ncbi:MAG: HAD family hydrolase [Oligoflexus sp.]
MQPLLIFDLDETLFHTCHLPLQGQSLQMWQTSMEAQLLDSLPADAVLEDPYFRYSCYKRPGIDEFLLKLQSLPFDLAVWTSSTKEYAHFFLRALFPADFIDKLIFIWSRKDCQIKRTWLRRHPFFYKDLSKVVEVFAYSLEQILMIDDTPHKVCKQPENLLLMPPWTGDPQDQALADLFEFLAQIPDNVNFRRLKKKNWQATNLP